MRSPLCGVVCVVAVGLSALAPSHAVEFGAGLLGTGQVREGGRPDSTEVPSNLYGALLGSKLHHGVGGETYFRLARDWSRADGATDFYLGFVRVPARGIELSLGRQTLDDAPGALYVADAGRIRFDRGGRWAFSLFGGQPRYFEPLRGPEIVSQDEQLFGGSVRLRWSPQATLALSFLQLQREHRRVNQLAGAVWQHTVAQLAGRPRVYALASYDTAESSLQQATVGSGVAVHPRVFLRLEGAYYKPQERSKEVLPGLDRFSDPLFALFSASSLKQGRAGLQIRWKPNVSWYVDYAFQRFEETPGRAVDGHRGSVGFVWLPEGDGLEVVRWEFYTTDSRGGQLQAGRAYYENRVYERVLLRGKIEVARFDKITNQSDTVVSSRVGVAYELFPGLLAELNVEGNRSPRFDQEFRLGFFLTYNVHYRDGWEARTLDRPVLRLPGGWAG